MTARNPVQLTNKLTTRNQCSMSRVASELRELCKVQVASILDLNQLHTCQNVWQCTRRGSAFKFCSPTVSSIQQYEAMVNQ